MLKIKGNLDIMLKSNFIVCLFIINTFLLSFSSNVLAESKLNTSKFTTLGDAVLQINKNLLNIEDDLNSYAQGAINLHDSDRVDDYDELINVMDSLSDKLYGLSDLLFLRGQLNCKSDKLMVAIPLSTNAKFTVASINQKLIYINSLINRGNKDAAFVLAAEKIKAELRSADDLITNNQAAFSR